MNTPILRTLNEAAADLDKLLTDLNVYSRAETSLRDLAVKVEQAAQRAPDIALATILLAQVGGRYAIRHCIDTAVLASLAARTFGLDEDSVVTVTAAALTMNVGMLREIDGLHARATVLDDAERARIRRHPVDGAELLRCAGVDDKDWIECVLQHHEAADGSGYPHGLRSDDIAASAALVGMADRYCACIGARNYRRSLLAPQALARLAEENAGHPELVRAFTSLLGAYPPGALVRLTDGCAAVVIGRDGPGLDVQALRDAEGLTINALRRQADIVGALHEEEARLRFSMKSVWGELAAL